MPSFTTHKYQSHIEKLSGTNCEKKYQAIISHMHVKGKNNSSQEKDFPPYRCINSTSLHPHILFDFATPMCSDERHHILKDVVFRLCHAHHPISTLSHTARAYMSSSLLCALVLLLCEPQVAPEIREDTRNRRRRMA